VAVLVFSFEACLWFTIVKRLTKSNNKLKLRIDLRDRNVDLFDPHLHAGIQLHQVGDFGVQADIGAQVFDGQFDAADVQFRDVEVDIWWCAGCRGTGARARAGGVASDCCAGSRSCCH
jgi:hypothetical protein